MPIPFSINEHSYLQTITSELLTDKKITLAIKRDDLLHPLISGNKWRKLKYNLVRMQQLGKSELLTFGG
ncbi:MAG: 1-aminocyclopropane-1-carboxylate deaminase/D-cysteine desulfhydrase, partial [Pseudoalteromonas tetraodonis]|nr:1-aminocyclopropane-1-carboxylate deaminase/D-cysteine desulfhydrase [Pseudoalteromonas tetraodonis]